jgi:light-regulated signal transduction histidine kinase (bacteriophytochrome)
MPADAVDRSGREGEPIEVSGSIQPHGCLLACDPGATVALRHSANLPEMLGIGASINGRPLEELLGGQALHDLRNLLTTLTDGGQPAVALGFRLASGARYDLAVHQLAGTVIAEFEPAGTATVDPLQRARALIGRIGEADELDRLIARAGRLLHGILGYDRVVTCRFEAGAGEVIAEVKSPGLRSLLGQSFADGEIPGQGRAVARSSPLRVIPDADGAPVPIVPERDAKGAPLDLSLAQLRGVSPIERAHLRALGAAAAMSISVIVDGRLWGLIACHHGTPRIPTMGERIAVELFGQFFSLRLGALS